MAIPRCYVHPEHLTAPAKLKQRAETRPATEPRRQRKHRRQQSQQGRYLRLARLHPHPRPEVFVEAAGNWGQIPIKLRTSQ